MSDRFWPQFCPVGWMRGLVILHWSLTSHSLICRANSFINHIRFYFENNNRTWHYLIPGNLTSAERRYQRGSQLEQKGVEPRTCGLLNQWHLCEELVLVISNSGLHIICQSVAFLIRILHCFVKSWTMRINVWIYHALVCLLVTVMDSGKTVSPCDIDCMNKSCWN